MEPQPFCDPTSVGREELHELLAKGWLTHDGMWFDQAARALGVEGANVLNLAAIRAMAPFEVSRLAAVLGARREQLTDAESVAAFVRAGIVLVTPASVGGQMHLVAAGSALHWECEPGECFAYKGMQRFGHLDGYRCGVIYRVECWLEVAGLRPPGEPVAGPCAMHTTGRCAGDLPLAL